MFDGLIVRIKKTSPTGEIPSTQVQIGRSFPIDLRISTLREQISDLCLSDQSTSEIQTEITKLQRQLQEIQPTGFEALSSELEKLDQNLVFYRSTMVQYHERVSKIDEITNSLKTTFAGPLNGLSIETANTIDKALSVLEQLHQSVLQIEETAGKVAGGAFSELVQAEINHIANQLEDWQKAIQERELYSIAAKEYEKDPSSRNEQRLQILHQEAAELQKMLPELKDRWKALTEHFPLEDHDDYFSQIESQIKHIHEKTSAFQTSTSFPDKESYFIDLPHPKRSWLGQAFHTFFRPEEWSDTTKDLVFRGFALMQLTASGANYLKSKEAMEQRAAAMQKELLDALPEEVKQGIEKDTAFLGTLLEDKWEALRDPDSRGSLLKRSPQTLEFLGRILDTYQDKPSSDAMRDLLDQYQLQRSIQANPLANPYQARSLALEEGLRTLFSDLSDVQSTLTTLAPEKGVTFDPKIDTLRQEMRTLSRALQTAVDTPPEPTCKRETFHTWAEALEQQCFSLQELERRAVSLMSEVRAEIDAHTLAASETELSAFGNKHKNLIKQARFAKALDLKGIDVPVPQGVKTEEVLTHLRKVAPEVFIAWETLQKGYQKDPSFLQTEEAKRSLQKIDHALEKAFQTFPLSEEMKEWLKKIEERGSYLMVRSTGAEDSREASNAGGNQSPAYVPAREKELREALGRVVRSYFGIGSLQNRLNAGINPFEEELSLAVTAQELIGEPIGGSKVPRDIPISLVAFTNEPLYIGDEKFRVFRLSATYGHGEGVVGNQGIESDTVLVLHSASQPDRLYILYDNHEKPERLAPVRDPQTQEVKLEKVANPECLVKSPALSGEQVARLFQWGIIAESYFEDDATDMEIVIKRDTIYPVQARPVNRGGLLPTYLDQKKIADSGQKPIVETIRSEVLVPGKASVVSLADREEILIADTLEQAERQFQKEKHKLVIVYQSEPANSHPVVNFSSLGVPCLYVPNQEEMERLMEQDQPIAVCMQAGEIHLWDRAVGDIADFTSDGFVVHPAKVAVSLPITQTLPTDARVLSAIPKEAEELIHRVRMANTQEMAFARLKQLRQHVWIKSFLKNAHNLQTLQREVRPIAKAAKALAESVEKAFSEIEATLSTPRSGRLETLLQVKVLETLLFATPQPGTSLGQHSVIGMQGNFAAAKALVDYQKKLPHTAYFSDILLAGTESYSDAVTKKWVDFLLSLEPLAEAQTISSQQILRLKEIVHLLQKAKIFPVYLTFFFKGNPSHPQLALEEFLASLSKQEEKVLFEILEQKKAIQREIAHLSDFSHPETFEKAFASLQKIHEHLFGGIKQPEREPERGFLQKMRNYFIASVDEQPVKGLFSTQAIWEGASIPGRFSTLEMFNDYTHAYDLAIKAMKASPHFSNVQKVQLFQRMLGSYYAFMSEVFTKTRPLQSYVETFSSIEKLLKESPETHSDQLQPSGDFSVAAAVVGKEMGLPFQNPQTLEDVFTLIHQTLLAKNARLANEMISAEDLSQAIPRQLKEVLMNLEKERAPLLGSFPMRFDRTKVEISPESIVLQYNVRLRNHSSRFTIKYHQETETIEIVAQLFGVETSYLDRGRREGVSKSVEICSELGVLPLAKPIYPNNGQEMRVTWNSAHTTIDTIFDFYHKLAQSTFDFPNDQFLHEPAAIDWINSQIQKKLGSYSASELLPFLSSKNLIFCKKFWEIFFNAVEKEKKYQLIEEAMKVISKIKDLRLQAEVLSLLVDTGQGYQAGINLAKDLLEGGFYSEGAYLLQKLVEKGQGYSQALEAVQGLVKKNAYKEVIVLFEGFLAQGLAHSEAIEIAKMFIDREQYSEGVSLFNALIGTGHGYSEAIEAAKLLVERAQNFDLFQTLVKEGEGYQEAIEAAQHQIQRGSIHLGVGMFQTLVKEGKGYQEAIEAAQHLIQGGSIHLGVGMFQTLLTEGQGHQEALNVAKQLIDKGMYPFGIDLFLQLFNNGLGYQEGIEASTKIPEEDKRTFWPYQDFLSQIEQWQQSQK